MKITQLVENHLQCVRQYRPRLDRSAIAVLLLTTCGTTFAGSYTLTQGAGKEVCERYRQNFEPRHDTEPMVCDRVYSPAIREFSLPKWQRIDVKSHLAVYRKALRFQLESDNGPSGIKMSDEDINVATSEKVVTNQVTSGLAPEMYLTKVPLNPSRLLKKASQLAQ